MLHLAVLAWVLEKIVMHLERDSKKTGEVDTMLCCLDALRDVDSAVRIGIAAQAALLAFLRSHLPALLEIWLQHCSHRCAKFQRSASHQDARRSGGAELC